MRIRTIKPEFWSHPVLSAQEPVVRLGAIGLLNLADDEGYFLAAPALVRSALFPLDSTSARRVLATLSAVGYIEVKTHPTHGAVGVVINFTKHQRIDRPSPSKIKTYYDSTNTQRTLDDHSLLYQGSGIREGKVKEAQKIGPSDEELDITSSKPLAKLPKTKLGLMDLNSIPGLKVIAKDQQKLLAVLNEVGLDVMKRATRNCLGETGSAWESDVTPSAYALHAESLKPPTVKIEPLPDRLTDLPITNPMNPNYWKNKGSQE